MGCVRHEEKRENERGTETNSVLYRESSTSKEGSWFEIKVSIESWQYVHWSQIETNRLTHSFGHRLTQKHSCYSISVRTTENMFDVWRKYAAFWLDNLPSIWNCCDVCSYTTIVGVICCVEYVLQHWVRPLFILFTVSLCFIHTCEDSYWQNATPILTLTTKTKKIIVHDMPNITENNFKVFFFFNINMSLFSYCEMLPYFFYD